MIYGSYYEPIQQARALHNLEHGAITIQYGSKVPEATVEALQGFYDENRTGTILAPYPKLGDRIVLSAWNAADPTDDGKGISRPAPPSTRRPTRRTSPPSSSRARSGSTRPRCSPAASSRGPCGRLTAAPGSGRMTGRASGRGGGTGQTRPP